MDLRGIIYQVYFKKTKVAVTLAERLTGREEAESEQGAVICVGRGLACGVLCSVCWRTTRVVSLFLSVLCTSGFSSFSAPPEILPSCGLE